MLRVLLVDQGMNTGSEESTRIGGGQIARRRFFSDRRLVEVTLLTSEKNLVELWEEEATIIFEPDLQTYRPTRADIAGKKVNWFRLYREGLRAARVLTPYLADDHYDVVFFNDNKSRMLYLLSRFCQNTRKMSARTALEVDGEWDLGVFDWIMKTLYLMFFDKIICATEAARKQLGFSRYFFSRKLLTAYPGVDLPETVNSDHRRDLSDQSEGPLVFGCIGTLKTDVKGQDLIVQAVERMVQKHGKIPVEIHFFGDGPDRKRLEDDISKKGLGAYFRFEGFVRDQENIYSAIDACILASRTEVAPLVLMECLVRNIPVIAADLKGCREILSPFYETMFFRRGNADSLASVLEKTLAAGILEKISRRLQRTDKHLISREYQAGRVFDFLSRS